MGQEIDQDEFTREDFAAFSALLSEETEQLRQWFDGGRFSQRSRMAGFELEAWLLDAQGTPQARNEEFLQRLNSELVVPELSRFNVELNGSPTSLTARAFTRLSDELEHTWRQCCACAEELGLVMAMIGILPTVAPESLCLDNISAMSRFRALNNEVLRMRRGKPLQLHIDGHDQLRHEHPDVMAEAAATSFQIHLQVRQASSVRLYNAAQAVSAPMVAISANSPFLFGKDLWAESRIPVFEQAVSVGEAGPARVGFGDRWVEHSLLELFEENLEAHAPLMPALQHDAPGTLPHLRFHNGTIWRWNRPLIGFDYDGTPHLRIEHRVVPAGPTITDAIANAAFFYGMVAALSEHSEPVETRMSFDCAKSNFQEAARHGLQAQLQWPDASRQCSVVDLICDELLPLAHAGLRRLGIAEQESAHFLGVIEARARSGQNGACWQRRWVQQHGADFSGLTHAYLQRQASGAPVHGWSL